MYQSPESLRTGIKPQHINTANKLNVNMYLNISGSHKTLLLSLFIHTTNHHTLTVWSSNTEHEWCPPLLNASAPLPSISNTPMAVTKNAPSAVGNPPTRLAEEYRDDFGDDEKSDEQRQDTVDEVIDEFLEHGNGDEYDNDAGGGMVLRREGIVPEFVFVLPPAPCLRTEAIPSIEESCW